MNNGRDCVHGRQVGKCADCEVNELEKRINELEFSLNKILEHQLMVSGEMAKLSTVYNIAKNALK